MRKMRLDTGALSGAVLTAPLIGVMYLADKLLGLPFIPFDLFDWLARVLPGQIVTFGIDLMIDTLRLIGVSVASSAKTAERTMAVGQFFLVGTVAGMIFNAIVGLRGKRPSRSVGVLVGAVVGIPMIAVSVAIGGSDGDPTLGVLWLAALFAAWGVSLQETYLRLSPPETAPESAVPQVGTARSIDRRQFLVRLGVASATITVASTALGAILAQAARRELNARVAAFMPPSLRGAGRPPFPNASDPLAPAPGTRPEYTEVEDHYQIFIRSEPTVIDGVSWTLPITGLVSNPISLTLDDIRSMYEPRDQYVTLSCISGRIGTDLISTTLWTGVSLQDILATVAPSSDARYLNITCGDGFHETVDLLLIASDERIMLCYAWDGHPLPVDHGFPLRIWLPDRYGMKQPKWITAIEVTEEYNEGYWVKRTWDQVARVEATSVIDTIAVDDMYESEGRVFVPVGGIAFAGARGISKVEVRVGDGEWHEASLRSPLSETTWVFWRYDWPFEPGANKFEVRCIDGNGVPQIEGRREPHPSGATGIHEKTVRL